MLIFRVFCFAIYALLLVNAAEYIRYKDIDVKLFSENDVSFQSKMEQVMKNVKDYRQEMAEKIIVGVAKIAGSFKEHIDQVLQVILLLRDLAPTGNEMMESLISAIPKEIERSSIRQEIVHIESRINTILFNMKCLNESIDIENDVKKSIVHNIHNDLLYVVNVFDHHSTNFKKHPLLAIQILFPLTTFVAVYHNFFLPLNPELANQSTIGCTLKRVLHEYQPLVIVDRLSKIKIVRTFIRKRTYGTICKYQI